MSLRRFFTFIHWPISTKLAVIFLVTVFLPVLIIVLPFTYVRQGQQLESEQKNHLQTVGIYQRTQPVNAVRLLAAQLNYFTTATFDAAALAELPADVAPLTARQREQIDAVIAPRAQSLIDRAPSLSRIRYYTLNGERVSDITANYSTVDVEQPTPADTVLQTGFPFENSMTTTIYPVDTDRNPGWDIVLPLAAPNGELKGYLVFTQNLAVAALDETLPNLYTALALTPATEYPAYTFLLTADGQLVSPTQWGAFFEDSSLSTEYILAQDGRTQTAVFQSSFLDEEVIGYIDTIMVPNGPAFMLVIETPLSSLRSETVEASLVTFILIGTGTLLMGLASTLIASLVIARPIAQLTRVARQVVVGSGRSELQHQARRDEIGILNNTLHEMAEQLLGSIHDLETRVAERTRNFETMLEIGRVLTSLRNLDMLLEEVVNLIRDQFDAVYHAQIFLINEEQDRANLRASTGAAGRQLLQRGHYLEVGSQSVIGSVTATGHAVVALDTSHNPIHRRNEFLPDTRAEMALPLRFGQRVIGALDLQSTAPDAFSEQDIELFQGMADQIAIVIRNATLFEESNARMTEIERLNRSLTETVWREVEYQHGAAALSAEAGMASSQPDWSELQLEAMQTRQIAERFEGDRVTFAVPILLREQVLGAVEWQVPQQRYTRDTRQTALELTTRLGLAAENIRLFEQSRRAAQREFVVNQISSKLVGTTDIDQILQTAVRELGLALHLPRTTIQLFPPDEPGEES